MSVNVLNPDSAILQQVDGHWQKMAMLILWKLNGKEKVRITLEDMQRFQSSCAPGDPVLFTHGHTDSIEFQIVDQASAARLAEHDASMRGTA